MKLIFRLALCFAAAVMAAAQSPIVRQQYTTNIAGARIPAGLFGTVAANTNVTAPAIVGTNSVVAGDLTVNTNATVIGTLNVRSTLTATNAVLVTPTIGDLSNMTHGHLAAGSGGTLAATAIPTTLRDTIFTNLTANVRVDSPIGSFNTVTATNGITTLGTNGIIVLRDDDAAHAISWEAPADVTTDVNFVGPAAPGTGLLYSTLSLATNSTLSYVPRIEQDLGTVTQAGWTNYTITFPSDPYLVSYLSLVHTGAVGITFNYTTNRAIGKSVVVQMNPAGSTKTNNVSASHKRLGTMTNPFYITNAYMGVVSFNCLGGTTETNVYVGFSHTQN
jgi:hypothetical protein